MVRAAALQTRQAKSAVNCEDLAGVCLTTKIVKTRQGEPMEFLTFEDHTDVFECVLFPDQYKVFNDLVLGINGFLQSLNIPILSASPIGLFMDPLKQKEHRSNPLPIHRSGESASTHLSITELESVDEVKRQMRRSPYLPDWYESIQSRQVADDLLRRLAEGYLHYQRQVGRGVSLEEYFKRYTDYLQKEGKLHTYCKYKGKPVRLDSDN